jgi:hypothetical protein
VSLVIASVAGGGGRTGSRGGVGPVALVSSTYHKTHDVRLGVTLISTTAYSM